MPAAESSPKSSRATLIIQITLLFTALAVLAWQAQPDGRLHLRFPAVDGDAIIVQLPSGATILIDGGANPSGLSAALGRSMPFWQRNLDAVILTNAGGRFLPGQVDALAHYHVLRAYIAPGAIGARGATRREWRRLLAEQRTAISTLRAGQRIELGDGVRLRVLAAGEGALLRIEYGATSAVLAHSSTAADEAQFVSPGVLRMAQLVVFPWERDPHDTLLQLVEPSALIYSDGYQADQPTLLSYAERRVGHEALYHERINGALEWISNGKRAWVVAEQ